MSAQVKPPVWKMVKEAVEALGGKTTNIAVRDWIQKKYPGTNPTTIGCQIIVSTVNHASRIHYPENQKPRQANAQYDFLFRPATGELEWYDPAKHGQWEIAELENGKLVVREVGKDDEIKEPEEPGKAFAAEAHLRDFLAKNLHVIEEGLQLYVDEGGTAGVEYRTDMGRIDILAADKNGGLLIVELKVERGPDEVCGQIMRYVGWVKRHLAKDKPVRGLIVAQHISERIRYALADVPNISAREYKLNITLHGIPHVDENRQ
ncbi:MAG: endonuclease NucS [Terriglobia bacterium]